MLGEVMKSKENYSIKYLWTLNSIDGSYEFHVAMYIQKGNKFLLS